MHARSAGHASALRQSTVTLCDQADRGPRRAVPYHPQIIQPPGWKLDRELSGAPNTVVSMTESQQDVTQVASGGSISPDFANQQILSVTLGRLAAPATIDEVRQLQQQRWWVVGQRAAADLQMTSMQADFWEAGLAPAVERGRSSELAGLLAGSGEQFALALAALAEAELWSCHRRSNPPDLESDEGRVLDADRRWRSGRWPNWPATTS
jgi:hypothetical protein